jgi:HEPN domain-containing protein
MQREESRQPDDWFRIGDKELRRAKILLENGDLDGAGFNIQQTVEKYLKGYLLSKGWDLKRIHDLEALLNSAIGYDPSLEPFRTACQKITDYYIEDRYPFMVASQLTVEEIKESIGDAEAIIGRIKELVAGGGLGDARQDKSQT